MKKILALSTALVVFLTGTSCTPTPEKKPSASPVQQLTIRLPEPKFNSNVSLEETLLKRRSIREYASAPLSLAEVAQLLWSSQGKTAGWGGRTAPSAGGTYPLEVYLVAGNVENLAPGIYKYKPEEHEITRIKDGDLRDELARASLDQVWVQEAAINLVISAVYERTTRRYGERGIRYVDMEAGHAAQNVYLQVTALNLGSVVIGAFHDDQVKKILNMPENESPLYVMPVGKPRS